jgi:hypothetical protein
MVTPSLRRALRSLSIVIALACAVAPVASRGGYAEVARACAERACTGEGAHTAGAAPRARTPATPIAIAPRTSGALERGSLAARRPGRPIFLRLRRLLV